MKLSVIKQLCEEYTPEQLSRAEEAIMEGRQPEIKIGGEDEGEQLTHVYAAIHIQGLVKEGMELKDALRSFTGRVRNSIS